MRLRVDARKDTSIFYTPYSSIGAKEYSRGLRPYGLHPRLLSIRTYGALPVIFIALTSFQFSLFGYQKSLKENLPAPVYMK